MAATIHNVGMLGPHMAMESHHKRDSSRVSVVRKNDRHGLDLKEIIEGIKRALNTLISAKGITRSQFGFPICAFVLWGRI
jgi:hypothetical protein